MRPRAALAVAVAVAGCGEYASGDGKNGIFLLGVALDFIDPLFNFNL